MGEPAVVTQIALLWRPDQADALKARLTPEMRTFPLSQKTCAAALAAGLPFVDTRYFERLESIDIPTLRQLANAAVHNHEAQHGPALHRPSIWHNAYEAAFTRAAAEQLIDEPPTAFICAAHEAEPEFAALAALCAARGIPLHHVPLARPVSSHAPIRVPADLAFDDATHTTGADPWRLLVAVAVSDLGDQMRKAAQTGAVVLAVDSEASGDADAIQALARALGNVRILPLTTRDGRFDERGENTAYVADVESQLARALLRKPAEVIVSDLRRVETALAVRLARAQGAQVTLHAHSASVMAMPYRFDETGVRRSVWTHSAGALEGADVVACPRAVRPPTLRRAARLAARLLRLPSTPRIGLVVTTNELFAAPEAPLAPMIRALEALRVAAPRAEIVLRLRRLEDSDAVWRAALPGVAFSVETRDDRPFIAFARTCDLIVEVGSESSAFLEAAAVAATYIRLDAPPPWIKRFNRPTGLVPLLSPSDAASLLRAPLRRLALGIRQFRALERDTRPA